MILSTLIGFQSVGAQPQFLEKYTIENGLPSNLVKTITRDNEGYIWIGTDDGLVRFDGKNFKDFANALPSQVIRAITYSSAHGILVLSDFGLVGLLKSGFEYESKNILMGSQRQVDSLLYNPRTLFVDRNNAIWIGETDGIVRYGSNGFKRYILPSKYTDAAGSRTYNFFEALNGSLYATSISGYVLYYNPNTDQWENRSDLNNWDTKNIYSLLQISSNAVYLGSSDGIYEINILDLMAGSVERKRVASIGNVNFMAETNNGSLLIGTQSQGLSFLKRSLTENKPVKLVQPAAGIVNYIYSDNDMYLVGTDEGFIVYKDIQFLSPLEENMGFLIRNLVNLGNNKVLVAAMDRLFFMDFKSAEPKVEVLRYGSQKNIYSVTGIGNKYWVSFRDGTIEYTANNRTKTIRKPRANDRIVHLSLVSENEVWGYIEDRNEIIKYDENGNYTIYSSNEGIESTITTIKTSLNGEVYLGGNSPDAYLYRFNRQTNRFDNISISIPDLSNRQLTINDLDTDAGRIWLGTNIGLFIYEGSKVTKVEMENEIRSISIKSVLQDLPRGVWLGTDRGLFLFNGNDDVARLDRDNGLPNGTIVTKCLLKVNNQILIAGTVSGPSYMYLNNSPIKNSRKPNILNFKVNEESYNADEPIYTGSMVTINYQSIQFPSDKIIYKSWLQGLETEWTLPTDRTEINYTNLESGDYTFLVEAKGTGEFWSEVEQVTFSVKPPFYKTTLAYIFYFGLFVSGIIYATVSFNRIKVRKLQEKQNELQALIDERTERLKREKERSEQALEIIKKHETKLKDYVYQLHSAYQEVAKANEFKSDLINIASHDLKNPLQTIIGYSEMIKMQTSEPSIVKKVDKVLVSSERMFNLVNQLLEAGRLESGQFKLSMKKLNLQNVVQTVIGFHIPQSKKKNQTLLYEFNYGIPVIINADDHRLKEVVDNLISNSIKFSSPEKTIWVSVWQDMGKAYISVKDEGPGLTEEDKKKLFGKFQRLSAKPTGGEVSTGLGLSIVKTIVELHGGTIDVKSKPGEGAEFIVQLPLLVPNRIKVPEIPVETN